MSPVQTHTCFLTLLTLLCTAHLCLGMHPLLVLLIDGFRFDYMDDLQTLQGFRELVGNGVKVDYVTPNFPSLSYPNYYSLMTGRYCEVHQMTGNYMWDEASGKEFLIGGNLDSTLPQWWNGSEPIWVTMQRMGKKAFMYYWPGCDVDILGVQPSFCEKYISSPSEKNFTDAIENALNVLRSGQADMAAIYFEKVDEVGHLFGPSSQQVKTAVRQLDVVMQGLNRKIKEKNMVEQLNVVIFSDHGMTEIQWMDKVVELDKYINMSDITKMMDRGAVVNLWPKDNKIEEVYAALSRVPNIHVYVKEEIPQRFHYRGGKFVSPLMLLADPPWFIIENKAKLPYWKNDTGEKSGWYYGWHGYDNEFLDMRGFFLATGPDFKRNVQAPPIKAVDVYNLMCRIVGVDPEPNNGSWYRVENLLSSSSGPSQLTNLWTCCMGLLGILLTLWDIHI